MPRTPLSDPPASPLSGPYLSEQEIALLRPEEQKIYFQALELRKHLLSPLDYADYVTGETERYAHAELLNAHIVALIEHRLYPHPIGISAAAAERDAEGVFRHPTEGVEACTWLDISMPPRHGKSFLVSEHTPPWFLVTHPDARVILTSYEAEFAKTWGLRSRQHITNHPEFGVFVSEESRAADNWNLERRRGGMMTAGAGGAITGKGAHLLIIDDPTKNAEDAMSETQRRKLWDWYKSTVETRLEPGGVGILMATRWHEDDLIGKATRGNPTDHYVLNLPALAFPEAGDDGVSLDPDTGLPDPLGRRPGEALCPARFSKAELEKRRDGTAEATDEGAESDEPAGRYWFNALYQGRPQIEGGGLISRPFRYSTPYLPSQDQAYRLFDEDQNLMKAVKVADCFRFATVDLAASSKTSADWTVFSVWDVTRDRDMILHDRIRVRMETPDHAPNVRKWAKDYKVKYVGVEKATYGLSLIQQLIREGGVSVRSLDTDKDKVSRAIPYANMIANKKVYFPKGAPWLEDWETEHLKFPNARHDDQVDTGAYAALEVEKLPVRLREARTVGEDRSLEARVQRRLQEMDKPKKRYKTHPVLGRWG